MQPNRVADVLFRVIVWSSALSNILILIYRIVCVSSLTKFV